MKVNKMYSNTQYEYTAKRKLKVKPTCMLWFYNITIRSFAKTNIAIFWWKLEVFFTKIEFQFSILDFNKTVSHSFKQQHKEKQFHRKLHPWESSYIFCGDREWGIIPPPALFHIFPKQSKTRQTFCTRILALKFHIKVFKHL